MVLVLSTVHIFACVLLIGLVLLQQGKGADIGSTLGGDSSSLFGPMTENPLKNVTTIVAIIFMGTSVVQAYRARYDNATEGRLFSDTKSQVSVEQVPLEASSTTNKTSDDSPTEGKVVTADGEPKEIIPPVDAVTKPADETSSASN